MFDRIIRFEYLGARISRWTQKSVIILYLRVKMVHSDLWNAKLLQKGDFGSWIRTDKLKKFWLWFIFLVKMEQIITLTLIGKYLGHLLGRFTGKLVHQKIMSTLIMSTIFHRLHQIKQLPSRIISVIWYHKQH